VIELTDEMRTALANALTDKAPVVVSYVDADGQPHLSFRGTTQVYSKDQIAFWARKGDEGVAAMIGGNPRMAFLYRNAATRMGWQFLGRAHVDDGEEARRAVYENSPEVERNADPERKGRAVIVDVDQVIQRGQVIMQR
jgi:Pyridoxamine 5'-phosphate oxidase